MDPNVDNEEDMKSEDISTHELLREHMTTPRPAPKRKKMSVEQKIARKKKEYTFYKCELCPKQFSTKADYMSHSLIHADSLPFSCPLCPHQSKKKKYLTRHIKVMHSGTKNHKCDYCGKMFFYKSNLNTHVRVHTGEKPYKCLDCGKAFGSTYCLSVHSYIHKNIKPFQCSFCEYACRDSSTLRKHQDRHMGLEKVYQCKTCKKCVKSKRLLKVHVAEKHLQIDVRKYACDVCEKKFKERGALTNHIKSVHERSNGCSCEICGHYVSNKANLNAHLRTHVQYRPHRCTYRDCDKRFKDAETLRRHSRIHYPEEQFPCKKCGRRFTRKHRLTEHMRQHDVKIKNVQCDYCSTFFFSKTYLINHIRRQHTGRKRKYICDLCGMVTHNKPSLVMHIKYGHGNENDKECKICYSIYKRHVYLKSHYWKCHQIRYKSVCKPKEKKQSPVEIKQEPLDIECKEEIECDIQPKQEYEVPFEENEIYSQTVLSEDIARTIIQNNKKQLTKVPEKIFDDFFIEHVMNKTVNNQDNKEPDTNKKDLEYVNSCVDKLLKKARKEKKTLRLKQKEAGGKSSNGLKKIEMSTENTKMTFRRREKVTKFVKKKKVDSSSLPNGKLKFNTHQCYICFKLYPTYSELLDHCKEHFDICNDITLKKCPLCEYVTKLTITKHMKTAHNIDIIRKVPFMKIVDRKANSEKSRYCYEFNNESFKEMEIIPSVKILNKQASMKIDEKNRKLKDQCVAKTKLVRKGGNWVVEKDVINVDKYVVPKFDEIELKSDEVSGDTYLEKIKNLSRVAKSNGVKMMFPCEKCSKICQTFSALKLHDRKHQENPKPFKKKVWKHKLKEPYIVNESKKAANKNRTIKPKPIVNNHKCDPKLMDFYEQNIRGGNIEFWQFLKIFNRMSKEKVTDFKDLETRTEFGLHSTESMSMSEDIVNELEDKINTENSINNKKHVNAKSKKVTRKLKHVQQKITKNGYKRVLRISKKEYERRNILKQQLREKISHT